MAAKDDPERLVSAARAEDENSFELKLRPRRLQEFIGQQKAKELLAIALEAAKNRGEALDHVLLFGPPGLGKTTLASIIANELDVGFQQTSGPGAAVRIQGDLTAIPDQTFASARSCFSTRFTFPAAGARGKVFLTQRLRTTSWTSLSGRVRQRARMSWTSSRSPSSRQLRVPACSPRRCARASASSCGWSSTPKRRSALYRLAFG